MSQGQTLSRRLADQNGPRHPEVLLLLAANSETFNVLISEKGGGGGGGRHGDMSSLVALAYGVGLIWNGIHFHGLKKSG